MRTPSPYPSVPSLGQGVYSLSEVARYADLNPLTARAWFKGRSDGVGRGPVFRSDYSAVNEDFAVSFLDLVDACVAGRFRRAGVKLSIVREAYRLLTDDLKTPHPFAHDLLYTDGRTIIVGVANRVNNPLLYDAISKQILFDDIGSILSRVDYREADHLAWRWRIAEGVEIDPTVSFGKPVVHDTGIETWVVSRQYFANNRNSALVADLFGIREDDVENAVEFERNHGFKSAA